MNRNLLINTLSLATLLISAAPVLAEVPANCETIKNEIAQRIIQNGVPADGFTLSIVPGNDDASQNAGKQVGYCGNSQYKILYQRHTVE